MTKQKMPDKNIYPEAVETNQNLLARKIVHLIETIKNLDRKSTQGSIARDSKITNNFLARLKSSNKHTYFDSEEATIDNFVYHITNRYKWLNLTAKLFWATTSLEEFDKKIAIKKSIIPRDFYSGIPRIDYEFSGRKSDIESLKELITNTRSPRINIYGPTCIGKTALLIELARQTVGPIFDTAVWVTARKNYLSENDLIPDHQYDIGLDSVVNAIIVQGDGKQDVHCLIFDQKFKIAKNMLKEHKILLMIDNFELVNDSSVYKFLFNIPDPSQVIATSRDGIDGFRDYLIKRLQEEDVKTIIKESCSQGKEIQLNEQEIDELENICGGNLVAIKWIIGQIASLNLRLDLIIKNLQDDSNTYILDHIFEFTFSKLDAHARVVLLTLANAPFAVTGNLIANSIVFNYSVEVEGLDYAIPDEVEKSLGILVKFGLISELRNDKVPSDARLSLSSCFSISLITVNYIKYKYKDFDKVFPKMLFVRFVHNLQKYDSINENDKSNLIDFLIVWADIAIAILNGSYIAQNYRELMRVYVLLKPFLGIVNTGSQKIPIAIFDVNATLYNTDAGKTFIEFINGLLLIENKCRGRTGECFTVTNTLHPKKNNIDFNDMSEKTEIIISDNLDENRDYEDYIQIRATIIYKDEDIKEISHYNQFTYP